MEILHKNYTVPEDRNVGFGMISSLMDVVNVFLPKNIIVNELSLYLLQESLIEPITTYFFIS